MDFKKLQKLSHEIAVDKGFWGKDGKLKRNDGELIALMHSELSEALEALRQTDKKLNNVGEELADCCIRIFDYCEAKNINLEKEIVDKLEKNKNRPFKHNKNF